MPADIKPIETAIVRCLAKGSRTENQLDRLLLEYSWNDIHAALSRLVKAEIVAVTNKRFWLRGLGRETLRKTEREIEYVRTYSRK